MSKNLNLEEALDEETVATAKVPETLHLEETSAEATVVWKIKNFFPMTNMEDSFDSPYFIVSDAKLHLQISLNSETDTDSDSDKDDSTNAWVSLYVVKQKLPKTHSVKYTLGIKRLDGSMFKSYSCECKMNSSLYGTFYFVRTSELQNAKNKVSLDNSLTVFCTIRVDTPRLVEQPDVALAGTQTSSSQSTEILIRNMEDLLLGEKYADAIFQVKDRKFRVHKAILSARSLVFGPMFEHDMVEKESGVVNIDDCEPEIFHDFLIFCYTGSVHHVTSNNAPDLYKLADKYDLKELKAECANCMGNELSVESFCKVVRIASLYNESDLLETATYFFIKNVKVILPTQDWQTFLKDHHLLANELFIQVANKN